MNNTFNIQRFGLLLKRKWLEFGKIYLIILAVAFGVIVMAYLIAFWTVFTGLRPLSSRDLVFREPLFMAFGFLFITAVASNYFAHLGQKSRTIIDLLIPASTFEKFLAGVFFTGVLTTASFIAIFSLTDMIFITKLRSIHHIVETVTHTGAHGPVTTVKDNLAYFFTQNKINQFLPLYVTPFFFTSIFLLGSVYFNKFHYIKTALSVMVFTGVWTLVIVNAGEYLTRNKRPVEDAGSFILRPGRDARELMLLLLLLVLTLIFWALTYVRLKEKEV